MSLSASMIDAMVQAGCTAEQLAAVMKADIAEREAMDSRRRGMDAERKRRQRSKDSVTDSHALSRDVTRTTRDSTEKAPDKVSPQTPFQINPKTNPPISPHWLPSAEWFAFEEMRQRIRKPMTDRARQLAINRLTELKDAGNDPAEVLNQSVMNSYQGLFPVKNNKVNDEAEWKFVGP